MDSVLPFPLLTFSVVLFITTLLLLKSWQRPRYKEAPKAPGSWPILGHLHLLSGKELPHKMIGAVADKYGPIFTIRLGVHRAVVVSDWKIAKEVYTTSDIALSSRPPLKAAQIMGYNNVMFAFAPYGTIWRESRKIAMSELLSSRRLELLKHVRDTEIKSSITELYKVCLTHDNVTIDMKQWFNDLTLNIVLRMIASKRYYGNISESVASESRSCQKALRSFMRLIGTYMAEDAVPYLGWLDLQGYRKEMKNTAKELDLFFHGWLDEHHKKRLLSGEADVEEDFMDVMLSMLDNSAIANCDNDTIIKATSLGMLKKVQDELDRHVGRDRHVRESDIPNLVYLQAIVKETLRLYPAGPLSGIRVAIEDCTLSGYHVKAGTRLIVNIWKILRDPSVWPDPSEFQPERFLTSHVDMDVNGQNFEFMPFGGGRRICPGIAFALQVMPLVMAKLLHGFDFSTEGGKPVDMTETTGLTNVKATPLDVVIKPRLRAEMYGL